MYKNTQPVPAHKPGTGRACPAYFAGGRILNIPVPQTGHLPFMAGRPLAILISLASEIFRLALHFTQ